MQRIGRRVRAAFVVALLAGGTAGCAYFANGFANPEGESAALKTDKNLIVASVRFEPPRSQGNVSLIAIPRSSVHGLMHWADADNLGANPHGDESKSKFSQIVTATFTPMIGDVLATRFDDISVIARPPGTRYLRSVTAYLESYCTGSNYRPGTAPTATNPGTPSSGGCTGGPFKQIQAKEEVVGVVEYHTEPGEGIVYIGEIVIYHEGEETRDKYNGQGTKIEIEDQFADAQQALAGYKNLDASTMVKRLAVVKPLEQQ